MNSSARAYKIENFNTGHSAKELLKAQMASLPGMLEVEARIESTLKSDAGKLVEVSCYLKELGGKRMRPALCLLIYSLFGEGDGNKGISLPNSLIDVAAGIELIHMATLLHDDIIDNSAVRRHQDSPYVKFGLGDTLLTGDFLLVRAFAMCARLDAEIISATEAACVELTEGEILETSLYSDRHTIESSLRIAEKKTAALFWLAAFSAGHIATASSELSRELKSFGMDLGVAFQIVDDILDVVSDEATLGKPTGIDIRERKPSLVNVLWLDSGCPLAENLRTVPGAAEDHFVSSGLNLLRENNYDVIRKAKETALSYSERARAALKRALSIAHELQIPVNESSRHLVEALIDYTIERVK